MLLSVNAFNLDRFKPLSLSNKLSSKLNDFAEDNFKFDENGRMFSKRI